MRCEGRWPSGFAPEMEEKSTSLGRLRVTDFRKGTPPPVSFVGVAGKGLKVACFVILKGRSARVANKGLSGVGTGSRVQAGGYDEGWERREGNEG
jgi:hypothetical protein